MKTLRLFGTALIAITLSMGLAACGEDEDDDEYIETVSPSNPSDNNNGDNGNDNGNNNDNGNDDGNNNGNGNGNVGDNGDSGVNLNGHEYVDLDLPSGTLWATTNVGATTPADYGDYFAWGETRPKNNYSWSTYIYMDDNGFNKYNTDSSEGSIVDYITVLEPMDDAATANWGDAWRTPTHKEQKELIDNCKWTWTSKTNSNGKSVKGYEVKSKSNNQSIFLPAAGFKEYTEIDECGVSGWYWSASLYPYYPYAVYDMVFSSDGDIDWYSEDERNAGLSVRPVCALH